MKIISGQFQCSAASQNDGSGCHGLESMAEIACAGNSHPELAQAIADRYGVHFLSNRP